jgi:hypothetical protein
MPPPGNQRLSDELLNREQYSVQGSMQNEMMLNFNGQTKNVFYQAGQRRDSSTTGTNGTRTTNTSACSSPKGAALAMQN